MARKDNKSSRDLKYNVPEMCLMQENQALCVCDVCIPHSWYTIEHGINDRFHVHVSNHNIVADLRPN